MNQLILSPDQYFELDVHDPETMPNIWETLLSDSITEVNCQLFPERNMTGRVSVKRIDQIRIVELYASAQSLVRDAEYITEMSDRPIIVAIQLHEKSLCSQNNQAQIAQAGDILVLDGASPFNWQFDSDFGLLLLVIPREVLLRCGATAQELRSKNLECRKLDSKSFRGSMTSRFIVESICHATSRDLNVDDQMFIIEQIWRMLLDCIEQSESTNFPGRFGNQSLTIDDIAKFIDLNISDSKLSAEVIAEFFEVSTRTIYKIFQDAEQSVSKLIIEKRLEVLAECLTSPVYDSCRITDLVYQCGFVNNTHASSAFKRYFDIAPSVFRTRKREGRYKPALVEEWA